MHLIHPSLPPARPFRLGTVVALACTWLLSALLASAQTAATGTISGRVFNPATQQYVANAEISVQGTMLSTTSASDGTYQIVNVPPGAVTVEVNYTGYTAEPARLTVAPGQTVAQDFNLSSSQLPAGKTADDTIVLTAFVVASEREGNSKAIMEQKRNMNITTSVASDIFGDVTDGNVGEFLKFLPGIDIDYVESETRGPRLGGLDAQYTGVTFDGQRLASADALRTGSLGRATSFEAFSISSIESIEVHRTTSSDMDADAPAGTINMKTRRAFDRAGRRIGYNFSLNLNSEEFHLRKTYGPGGRKEYKARPNFNLEYSDVFLDKRLGIVVSANHVDSYTEQYRENFTIDMTPTATDPRPMVIRTLNFKDGNKNISKDTFTVTTDFKASARLTLSNTVIYNWALGQFFNREVNFVAANRAQVDGNGVTDIRTKPTDTGRSNTFGGGNASKFTNTITVFPRFEYKISSWLIDGGGTWSRSVNNYDALENGHARSEDVNGITSDWIATRADPGSRQWVVQQTGGPDWFNLYNRSNPRTSNEGRFAFTEDYVGDLNARWVTPLRTFPTTIKFGAKWREELRKNENLTTYYKWSYIGPGGNTLTGYNAATGLPLITTGGSWGDYPNRNLWSTGSTGMLTTKNPAGETLTIPRADPNAISDLFHAHPEYFVNNATADDYYNAFIGARRHILETVTAGYGMADVKASKKIQLRAGLRWEKTALDAEEFDPLTNKEVVAAGYPVNTAGRASTIAGIKYQYFTKPLVNRKSDYADYFPMVSAKYTITQNLQFHAGYNEAISRPSPDSLSGPWSINEDLHLITSPNPNLKPEYSKNYSARLAYYFEPAGQLSVTVSQNDIRNRQATRRGTAEEFGLADDPVYSSYEFQAPFNVSSPSRNRSIEYAYAQTLPFEPEWARNITVNLAYTHTYAEARRSQLVPHRITSSLGYRYKRFSARLGVVWRDDTPWAANTANTAAEYGYYRRHDIKYDLGGDFKLNKYASLFFQGRNIFNDGQTWMQSTGKGAKESRDAMLRTYENYGANWNFGVKGTF